MRATVTILLTLSSWIFAQTIIESFKPQFLPTAITSRLAGEITLDGTVDTDEWRDATRISGFVETFPGDQTEPPIGTEAFVTYDDENFYVAFRIKDDPNQIRYSLRDRDQIWQDDYAGILLDTYGDGGWAYFIAANPLGIQGDTRITGSGGEDVSYDLIYKSEGKVTNDGYTIEMMIPFRSLRFPDKNDQQWRINFWITHPRDSRRTYSWAAIDRDKPCWLCQYGTLSGINEVQSSGNLEILPALVSSQAGQLADGDDPGSNFDNGDVEADLSLNVKYGFSSNLTADLAINPDFSQVEADAARIDVNSTFALFFPERRPFFQEGSDLFGTNVRTFYTRTINNPQGAARLTGRWGRTSIAYIGARDRDTPVIIPFEEQSEFIQAGKSISNILRVKQTFLENSHVGLMATDRRLDDGGSNSTAGIDWRYQLQGPLKQWRIEGNVVASRTEEPDDSTLSEDFNDVLFDNDKLTARYDGENFNGSAGYFSLERDGRNYILDVDYRYYTPTFRADNGFVTQNSQQTWVFFQMLRFNPESHGLDQVQTRLIGGYFADMNGLRKDRWIRPSVFIRAKGQTGIFLGYVYSDERFRGKDFDGIERVQFEVGSNFSELFNFDFEYETGRWIARNEDTPVLGKGTDIGVSARFRPSSRFNMEPRFSFATLHDPNANDELLFEGYIFRTRFNYQFTRELFLRTVVQYNNFNDRLDIDPLLTYRLNPFTAFYIGSSHGAKNFDTRNGFTQTSRQFFLKLQYLFRA